MIRLSFNSLARFSLKKIIRVPQVNCFNLTVDKKFSIFVNGKKNFNLNTKISFPFSQQNEISKLQSQAEQTKLSKGENSMQYLESLHQLSFAYAKVNSIQKAVEIYEKIAKKFEKNIDDKMSPALGDTFKNLQMLYKRAGKLVEFIPLTLRIIEIRKKESGENSKVVANQYNELGVAYYHIQNYNQALSNYQQALRIREKQFGPNTLQVIEIQNNIATTYYSLGQFDKSKKQFEENILKLKSLPNFDEKMIITPLTNLGASLEHQGRHEEALKKYQEVISILKRIQKKESYFMANIYHSMGIVCLKSGKIPKAYEYHTQSLRINKSIYAENHPSVAQNYHNLGICYQATGKFDKSIESYNKSISIKEKIIGKDHPSVAETYNNLGIVHKLAGNLQKSKQSFEKAIQILKVQHSDETTLPIFGDLYFNIGSIQLDLQDFQKANLNFDKAQNIFKNFFDEVHPKFADLFFAKARIQFIFTRNFSKAREYLDKSIRSHQKYAPNNPNAYIKYSMKGSCYFEQKKFQDAKQWYEKSLQFLKNTAKSTEEHLKVNSALLKYQIGACQFELRDYQKAHQSLSIAIQIFEKHFGEALETLVELYFMQANIEKKLNNKVKSDELFKKSCNLMEKLLEKMPEHPILIKKLEEIKKNIEEK